MFRHLHVPEEFQFIDFSFKIYFFPVLKPFNTDPTNPIGAEIPSLGDAGSTYFKVFYTDAYIYVLINVNDDVHKPYWNSTDFPNKPGDSWKYDKAEFYMDVNHILKDGFGPAWNGGEQDAGHGKSAAPSDIKYPLE